MDHFDCRCPHGGFDRRVYSAARATLGRRQFLIGSAATLGALALGVRAVRAADSVTVYKAARLFDGFKLHAPGVLVVKGSQIVSMNAGDAGSDARVIDLGDATLMPGLIDCHTHVAGNVVTSAYMARKGFSADNVGLATIYGV